MKKMNKLAALILALLMLVSATTAFAGTYVSDPVSPTISKPDDGGQQPELEVTPAPEGEAVLEPTPAPEGEQTVEETPAPQEIEATVLTENEGGNVNIRAAASTDSEILGQLSRDARVTVLGVEGDWTKIRADGIVGYVFSTYLQVSAPEETVEQPEATPTVEPQTTEEAPAEIGAVVTAGDENGSVDIRAAASGDAEIIGQLTSGMNVTILGVEGDWSRIRADGVEGYVLSAYLQVSLPVETTPAPVDRSVSIQISDTGAVHYGDTITLTGVLNGYEGLTYTVRWQVRDAGGSWSDISGADGLSYSFALTEENAHNEFRIQIDVEE